MHMITIFALGPRSSLLNGKISSTEILSVHLFDSLIKGGFSVIAYKPKTATVAGVSVVADFGLNIIQE